MKSIPAPSTGEDCTGPPGSKVQSVSLWFGAGPADQPARDALAWNVLHIDAGPDGGELSPQEEGGRTGPIIAKINMSIDIIVRRLIRFALRLKVPIYKYIVKNFENPPVMLFGNHGEITREL
jgi:hypothetical protein